MVAELDQEHAGEVDRGGDRRRRGADHAEFEVRAALGPRRGGVNGGDVVQTAPSSGRAAADISAAVAELELDQEHAGEVDRGDGGDVMQDAPSSRSAIAERQHRRDSHALSGAACQADTHRRNAAMFLAIGALALPRSRRVAGRVTGDAAALSATAGDGVERELAFAFAASWCMTAANKSSRAAERTETIAGVRKDKQRHVVVDCAPDEPREATKLYAFVQRAST